MQKRLLVIEDDALFLSALMGVLAERMPEVEAHTAFTAEQGLRQLRKHKYDVILSDFRLSGLDGVQFLKECQLLYPSTPVVLLTGYGDQSLQDEAVAHGAYAFLHKPVRADVLHATLLRALLLQRRSDESPTSDSVPCQKTYHGYVDERNRDDDSPPCCSVRSS